MGYELNTAKLFFAGANVNAAIWQAIALTTLLAGRHSDHYRISNGPAPSVFIFLDLLLFAVFTVPAFFKINKVEDVYRRRFRWIFGSAWGIWFVILAFEALAGGNSLLDFTLAASLPRFYTLF